MPDARTSAGKVPEYYLIDFDWDGYTQWTLRPDEADALLETWVAQIQERAGKLMHFLGAEGFTRTRERFDSDELDNLERFIVNHCDLYQHPKDQEYYLTDFSFEICKDTAALIGSLCQDRVPELKWSLNTDRNSGMMYQSIGMQSVIDGDHIPLLHLVCEFAEEALRKRQKFLGAFRKQRRGFLVKLLLLVGYEQEVQA
ncbi:hypothetical protein [Roseobacter sinensis]|uniref:Uncharacterized protein n=1 Tax=Roseobacter sinensis TaxID=2931391 RepID=A0ABT3BJC2_9RHOB|nr:hypothetical protein [Roseobacter sp. WL0113]MCV3273666.1 hypothetical protein [Roseobacter sp. WL0113]